MVGSERPAKRQKVEQDVTSIDRTVNRGWRRVMSFSSFWRYAFWRYGRRFGSSSDNWSRRPKPAWGSDLCWN